MLNGERRRRKGHILLLNKSKQSEQLVFLNFFYTNQLICLINVPMMRERKNGDREGSGSGSCDEVIKR